MKKKKTSIFGRLSTILLVLIMLAGFGLIAYPTFSDYWNQLHQTRSVAHYVEAVASMTDKEYDKMWKDAKAYNKELSQHDSNFSLSAAQEKEYESQLSINGTGMMGYIEIDKINCMLPIYHGTEDTVLQTAIGHIPGTSLPVGGKSTHCVISGHRGLPSAKLFTDLDMLQEGDIFVLHTLDKMLTYEVDQIRIVLPADTDDLQIEEGKDLCTLVTCTPYGVNSHRLLVRGHRVPNQSSLNLIGDANQIDPVIVAPFVAIPILLVLLAILIFMPGKNKKKK